LNGGEPINQLAEAQAGLKLSLLEKSLTQIDLQVIDEVGYAPFSEKGSQLFFQVVAQGYERQSSAASSCAVHEYTISSQRARYVFGLTDTMRLMTESLGTLHIAATCFGSNPRQRASSWL